MPYLIAALIALAVTGLVLWVGSQMFPAQPEVIRRLQEMPGQPGDGGLGAPPPRGTLREAAAAALRRWATGSRRPRRRASPRPRRLLTGAGLLQPQRAGGSVRDQDRGRRRRSGCSSSLSSPAIAAALDLPRNLILLIGVWGVVLGWVAPTFISGVAGRIAGRRRSSGRCRTRST